MAKTKLEARIRRKQRIRKTLGGTPERPRLTVFRSIRHIYAQVIDDESNTVLVSVGTLGKEKDQAGKKVEQAKTVGKSVAEACVAKGITKVVFDRNGFQYHGRVKALAEAAREGGLVF